MVKVAFLFNHELVELRDQLGVYDWREGNLKALEVI